MLFSPTSFKGIYCAHMPSPSARHPKKVDGWSLKVSGIKDEDNTETKIIKLNTFLFEDITKKIMLLHKRFKSKIKILKGMQNERPCAVDPEPLLTNISLYYEKYIIIYGCFSYVTNGHQSSFPDRKFI